MNYKKSIKLCFVHFVYDLLYNFFIAILLFVILIFLYMQGGSKKKFILDFLGKDTILIDIMWGLLCFFISQKVWKKMISKYNLKFKSKNVTMIYSFLYALWSPFVDFVFKYNNLIIDCGLMLSYPVIAAYFLKDCFEK
jgi:hypothetical protein